jgi:pimeloyl-ACP methyl ester carboxylesterase
MSDPITLADGRKIGFADYGEKGQTAVLWRHGGRGNRLEPKGMAPGASAAGLRVIGIDRPGYGKSSIIGEVIPAILKLRGH